MFFGVILSVKGVFDRVQVRTYCHTFYFCIALGLLCLREENGFDTIAVLVEAMEISSSIRQK